MCQGVASGLPRFTRDNLKNPLLSAAFVRCLELFIAEIHKLFDPWAKSHPLPVFE
jgi:hypothetical protein